MATQSGQLLPRERAGLPLLLPEEAGADRVTGRLGALDDRDGLLLLEGIALLPREGAELLPREGIALLLREGAELLLRGMLVLRGGGELDRDGALEVRGMLLLLLRGRLVLRGWLERDGTTELDRPDELEGRVRVSSRRGGGLEDGRELDGAAEPAVRREDGSEVLVGGR